MSQEIVCPGKVMLAGEYAVVDGGPAILLGLQAYAHARIETSEQELSPFLSQVHRTMVREYGGHSSEAQAALRVRVDTSAFRHDSIKLGLGSSAAATVAATAAALAAGSHPISPEFVHRLAAGAHADSQAAAGARGSGADVAACCFGGCIRFQSRESGPTVQRLQLPPGLHLRFPWTGIAASTPALVAQVRQYRADSPSAYANLAAAIAASAEDLGACESAREAVLAIEAGKEALRALAEASGAALWLPEHEALAALADGLGGALKPTGAGGGDLALAAFESAAAAAQFDKSLAERGIPCPRLGVDTQGVRLQA